jgi:hypothetical protein
VCVASTVTEIKEIMFLSSNITVTHAWGLDPEGSNSKSRKGTSDSV